MEEEADAMAEGLAQQRERELWQVAEHEQRLVAMMCHPYQLEEAAPAEEDMMEGQFEEGGDDEEEGEEAWAATTTQIPTKIPRFHSPVPPGGRVNIHTRFEVESELPGAFGEVGVLSCFKGPPPSTVASIATPAASLMGSLDMALGSATPALSAFRRLQLHSSQRSSVGRVCTRADPSAALAAIAANYAAMKPSASEPGSAAKPTVGSAARFFLAQTTRTDTRAAATASEAQQHVGAKGGGANGGGAAGGGGDSSTQVSP
jgi:hypothetical protein